MAFRVGSSSYSCSSSSGSSSSGRAPAEGEMEMLTGSPRKSRKITLPSDSSNDSASSSSTPRPIPVEEDKMMIDSPFRGRNIGFRSNSSSYSSSFSSSSSTPFPVPAEKKEEEMMIDSPPRSLEAPSSSYPPSKLLTPNTKGLLICPLDRTPESHFQFDGFREVKRTLIHLQKESKNRGIRDGEIAELRDLIASKNIENLREKLVLLKLLSEHFFFGMEDIFHEILSSLQKESPEISEYMETVPDMASFGPVLTPQGVQKILNFYEEHYEFPKGALSCQPLSALIPLLNEMEEDYRDGYIKEKSIQGWAVYNDDFEEDKHFSPVFAICQGGKVHVFVFDSQGHQFCSGLKPRICQSLEKLLKMFNREDIEVYSYKEKRQNGQVECSMYTILDLKNLVEFHLNNPETTIVDFYQKNRECCSPIKLPDDFKTFGSPPNEITQLIPAMLKPTQSLSRLRGQGALLRSPAYRVNRRLFGGGLVKKEQNPNAFQQEIEAYSSYSRGGDEDSRLQNSYISQHRLEYFIYLLASILEPSKPVRNTSPYSSPKQYY